MTQRSMFFDSIDGDRSYDAAAFAALISALVQRDGVVYGYNNALAVSASDPAGMSVQVTTGAAVVLGHLFEVYGTAETLAIDPADPANLRIDRVVIRLDLSNGVRSAVLAVKTGVAQAVPVAPALQRDVTVWELSLAQVAVGAGVTSIVAGNITDERSNATVCGYSGLVNKAGDTMNGVLTCHGVRLATGVQETGKAVVAFQATAAGQYTRVAIPFRSEMSNIPSSITLSAGEKNVVLGGFPLALEITKQGFELSLQSSAAGYCYYIKGVYTTVGN
jgi:hypothetical protein